MFEPIFRGEHRRLREPIFLGEHRRGIVTIAPTDIAGLLSVSVEDHSSDLRPPERLCSFLERSQIAELHQALGKWLFL